jgi:pimeloyl-ACP methyl ester carboxylesterase
VQTHTVQVDGLLFRWRSIGAGSPLVLVHGLAGSWRWWRPILPALSAQHSVHLLDLPGFGTFPRARRFDLDSALEWLARWSGAAAIGPADLVGHSLGALLCARLAARHPEAVERLVLVAPAGVPDRTAVGSTGPLLRALLASRPSFLALLARDAVRSGPVTILSAAFRLLAADVRSDLAAVHAPTLVVLGENDPLVPRSHGEEVARLLPHARLHVLAGAGHVPMSDRPEEFSHELLRFLAEDG